jgi:invasion protein IalB
MVNVLSTMIVVASLLISVAHAQSTQPITWAKWCVKETTTVQDKEEKEAKREADVCRTSLSQIDRNLNTVLLRAVLLASLDEIVIDGHQRQRFRVWVRSGVSPYASIRLTFVPKDLWEKVQKDEKIERNDEAALERFTFNFVSPPCHPTVCAAEVDATPEFLTNLKGSGGFTVHATSESGTVVTSSVALAGFAEALAGEPDNSHELLLRAGKHIPRKKTMRCDEGDWPGCKLR